jgi:hypothetical protein
MKTAVEWLENEYLKLDANFHYSVISYEECRIKRKELFTQAKEMEIEQHKQTWTAGLYCETGDRQAFIEYYNETFKSE